MTCNEFKRLSFYVIDPQPLAPGSSRGGVWVRVGACVWTHGQKGQDIGLQGSDRGHSYK